MAKGMKGLGETAKLLQKAGGGEGSLENGGVELSSGVGKGMREE
jgi:hypothetical protein